MKIYKPVEPQFKAPNPNDAKLPWVYDQDPSSGFVASMEVIPVADLPALVERVEKLTIERMVIRALPTGNIKLEDLL